MSRGNGWATSRLVGNPKGIPIRSQKQLRDKNGKSHNNKWYKKGVAMNLKGGERGGGRGRKKRKDRKQRNI